MNELSYKEEIEELNNDGEFEKKGDEIYLNHQDDEARLEWAFYRPSGSHPKQLSDENTSVAIMAFNHSRLGALERFKVLNQEVIIDDKLRNKIRNRSRMLFRSMLDNDFTELVEVLQIYPVFFDLAYDQMINGRVWNEIYANPVAASTFLNIAGDSIDKKLIDGLKRRLKPIKSLNVDECKEYLDLLNSQAQKLHIVIKEHYVYEFELWVGSVTLHPLQKVIWQKHIDMFKELE